PLPRATPPHLEARNPATCSPRARHCRPPRPPAHRTRCSQLQPPYNVPLRVAFAALVATLEISLRASAQSFLPPRADSARACSIPARSIRRLPTIALPAPVSSLTETSARIVYICPAPLQPSSAAA